MSLRDNKVDRDSTRNIDMRGRRTVRAGDAIDSQDYVTLKQLQELKSFIETKLENIPVSPKTIYTTFTKLTSTGLSVGDSVWITDYRHSLQWDGKSFSWGNGEDGANPIVYLVKDPGFGWKLLDGTGDDGVAGHSIALLKGDGTLDITTIAVAPNLTSGACLLGGVTFSTTVNLAVVPTLTMNSYTPAGTISQPTFTGDALAGHQHTTPSFMAGTTYVAFGAPFGTGVQVTPSVYISDSGTTSTPSAGALTNSVSAGTPTGTVSQPTFTGTAAVLTGSISLSGGTPVKNLVALPYIRK